MGKVNRNALREGYKLHWYTIKEILGKGGLLYYLPLRHK